MTTNVNLLTDFVQSDKIVMIDFYNVDTETGESTYSHSQEMGEYKNSGSICLHDGVEIKVREAVPGVAETEKADSADIPEDEGTPV